MKYKRIIYIVGLFIFFSMFWLWINRNCFGLFDELGKNGIVFITTSEAGFNCILEHGIVYAGIYIIILNAEMPKMNIQFFVRKKRIFYLLEMYKRIFITSIIFGSVYILVFGLWAMIFEKKQLLLETHFFEVGLLLYIVLILYYIFVGCLYGMIYTIKDVSGIAIVRSLIVNALIFLIGYYNGIWTPVMSLNVYDKFYSNELSLFYIIFNVIKIILLIVGEFIINKIIIESKDIANEKN